MRFRVYCSGFRAWLGECRVILADAKERLALTRNPCNFHPKPPESCRTCRFIIDSFRCNGLGLKGKLLGFGSTGA